MVRFSARFRPQATANARSARAAAPPEHAARPRSTQTRPESRPAIRRAHCGSASAPLRRAARRTMRPRARPRAPAGAGNCSVAPSLTSTARRIPPTSCSARSSASTAAWICAGGDPVLAYRSRASTTPRPRFAASPVGSGASGNRFPYAAGVAGARCRSRSWWRWRVAVCFPHRTAVEACKRLRARVDMSAKPRSHTNRSGRSRSRNSPIRRIGYASWLSTNSRSNSSISTSRWPACRVYCRNSITPTSCYLRGHRGRDECAGEGQDVCKVAHGEILRADEAIACVSIRSIPALIELKLDP